MTVNYSKLEQLVLYIVGRVEDPRQLGATKLHKILWYSETSIFARTGRSITDAAFVRAPRGPYCPHAEKAVKALKARELLREHKALYGGYTQRQIEATAEADLTLFTAEEISIVDRVIETIVFNHTAPSISALSHDRFWELIPDGQPMPLTLVFGTAIEAAEPEDLEWARCALGDRSAEDVIRTMVAH